MDIKINNEDGKFKFRVCGILKFNNKYLVVKINNNKFYCLPGGHVELGEDTNEVVVREMEEELSFKVKIEKMLCVVQNFFKDENGKTFHELGYYYVVTPEDEKSVNAKDYERDELDKGKIQHLDFKWVTLEELKNLDFRPKVIVEQLSNDKFVNIIVKD